MSKKLTELQAGALNAWTPTQQAALYHHHLASQVAADEAKLDEEERKKKKDEGKEDKAKGKPEEVRTGEVLDGLIKYCSPPLFQFVDLFGPPHISLPTMLVLHGLYWPSKPFEISWDRGARSRARASGAIFNTAHRADRPMWQAYWVLLSLAEYGELVCFGDTVRGLVWWPVLKVMFCLAMYSVWERDEKRNKHTLGATKVVGHFLPELPKDDKAKDKDKDKAPGSTEKSSSSSSSSRSKPPSSGNSKSLNTKAKPK
ncbi:hypothetical protein EHS25_004526 [Saitozyma podzolica]|uniref:Uncharacterized protein n=1 Tax=Saitozyma podzolica TaxID=1890683 RepID=A0A427YUP4_9TREE|nr:hypothetical protein EHS25_004526 [Saitozyma podzolica]